MPTSTLKYTLVATIAIALLTSCAGGSSTAITAPAVPQTAQAGKHATSPCPCLYVTNLDGGGNYSVTGYAAGATGNAKPIQNIAGSYTQLEYNWGIAVDDSENIYAANSNDPGAITVYAAGSNGDVPPIQDITGSNTGLNNPWAVAIDPVNGDIYAANGPEEESNESTITAYSPGANGNVAPIATIGGTNTGLSDPQGLALDASGNIYVGNSTPSITVYAAGANGNVAPIRTIAGRKAKLCSDDQLALDSSSNIYVVNACVNAVTVYAASANGNVAPIRELKGGNTKLKSPYGIALDASNNVYVSNLAGEGVGGYVTEYAAGATGDVAPINTIKGKKTGMSNMRSIALH